MTEKVLQYFWYATYLRRVYHVTKLVSSRWMEHAMVVSILTRCALVCSMCNLKAAQIKRAT